MVFCRSALWLILFWVAPLTAWAQAYAPQEVVYHVNYGELNRINATFGNINNHIEAVGEDAVDIKVMVHGAALEYFIEAKTDTDKQMALDSLRFQDVQFLICNNTLLGYKLTRNDLYDVNEEDMVQAGLPAIVALQQAGYFYLRP
jgi:intracellular sulfur oxidation DsrE/DsrF family protein